MATTYMVHWWWGVTEYGSYITVTRPTPEQAAQAVWGYLSDWTPP